MKYCLFILCCYCHLMSFVLAEPARLRQHSDQTQHYFHYNFLYNKQPYQLSFSVEQQVLNNHFRQLAHYSDSRTKQYLWRDLLQYAAQYPDIVLQTGTFQQLDDFSVKTVNPQQAARRKQEFVQFLSQKRQHYLAQQYHTEVTFPSRKTYIMPDHVAIMQQSLTDLTAVSDAIRQATKDFSEQEFFQFVTDWLQQIPHQPITDRADYNGYRPPLRLLQEHTADSDSKVVLLAALLRILKPELTLAMLYLPQHALLAVEQKTAITEPVTNINGTNYRLLDLQPAPPASLTVNGQTITSQQQLFIQNRFFAWRVFDTQATD